MEVRKVSPLHGKNTSILKLVLGIISVTVYFRKAYSPPPKMLLSHYLNSGSERARQKFKNIREAEQAHANPMTICLQECYKWHKYLKGFCGEGGFE